MAIYGLTRPAGEPAWLDRPCPSCTGNEAMQAAVTVDARTGERTPLLIGAVAAIVVGLAIIGGGVAMGIVTWVEGDEGIIEWRYGSKVAGAAFVLIGLSFGMPVIRYGLAYFAAERVTGTLNRCVGCGNTWTVLPDGTMAGSVAAEGAAPQQAEAEGLTCIEGPSGCWGPVHADATGKPLCRGHLAKREHAETLAPSGDRAGPAEP